jgi:glutathione S-transferase
MNLLQGPYFGQHAWFHKFHPEDLPSAKKRYDEQVLRVLEVLNRILEGKEYLVGNKWYVAFAHSLIRCWLVSLTFHDSTYVDLAFVPWDRLIDVISKDLVVESDAEKKYPNFFAWHNRLLARPAVKKVYGL